MNPDATFNNAEVERRNLLGEWRRRGPGIGKILESMPRTRHTAIYDAAFPQWSILMLADIRERRDFALLTEHGDSFAGEANDASSIFSNCIDRTDFNVAVLGCDESLFIDAALAQSGCEM